MTRIITIAAVVLMLCTTGVVFAQTEDGSAMKMTSAQTCVGTVVSVSDQSIVVRTDAGETMQFSRDAIATTGWAQGIKAGDHVEVAYRTEGDQLIASSVKTAGATSAVAKPAEPMAPKAANPAGAQTQEQARSSLPQTASDLPVLGLAGLAFFLAAYLLRRLRVNS